MTFAARHNHASRLQAVYTTGGAVTQQMVVGSPSPYVYIGGSQQSWTSGNYVPGSTDITLNLNHDVGTADGIAVSLQIVSGDVVNLNVAGGVNVYSGGGYCYTGGMSYGGGSVSYTTPSPQRGASTIYVNGAGTVNISNNGTLWTGGGAGGGSAHQAMDDRSVGQGGSQGGSGVNKNSVAASNPYSVTVTGFTTNWNGNTQSGGTAGGSQTHGSLFAAAGGNGAATYSGTGSNAGTSTATGQTNLGVYGTGGESGATWGKYLDTINSPTINWLVTGTRNGAAS